MFTRKIIMRKYHHLIVVCLILLLTSFSTSQPTFKDELNQSLMDDATISVIQDGEIAVVNIWATWCGPCIREIPELNELVSEYKGKNVRFLAFSAESASVFDAFLEKRPNFKFDYELSFANRKSLEMLLGLDKQYQGRAIPLHILINKEGQVENVFVGASPENIEKIKDFLAIHAKN
jgi:thiol-disulfide isomerase/thioredoxin